MGKAKVFDIRRFPQDVGRVILTPLMLLNIKKVTLTGEKYTHKLKGGYLLTANHTSMFDPLLLGSIFPYRRMFYLVAEAVMAGKIKGILLRGMGCIKIDRNGTDIEAVKKSVALLKEGRVLTVFPQGKINKDDSLDKLKSGTVLMALKAKTPILPLYIEPKRHWYSARRVVVGNEFNPSLICNKKMPSTQDIEALTDKLKEEMNLCKNFLAEENDG